ncbi:LysR substrate-binding domain-containing protein [Acidovorax sp. SUPP3334]|uniref:LysR substrate-binding domain-containing protein n=1 Tax=Acidovorax sp. SUPP3334 TaxID=2920881 RepID=UPI0023DE434C|nr:LysR substrate-binding domain-containing protein [Acidovorax sp. SUPP3334]GKT20366.1 LysR family transcriptional regulator [Acidovorax sp. SUPP3334]
MNTFPLDQLRTFAAVIDAGSLTAGAPRVFLSQSAVSEQLRKLEEQAGQSLLLRSKAGVQPTAAGERLLGHARKLLALSEEAWRDLHGVALQGTLRLGITDYFRPAELAGLLARMEAQYPLVRLQVTVQKSGLVEAGYTGGEFDVAVTMALPATRAAVGAARAHPAAKASLLRQEALHWMAAPGLSRARGEPLRLLALPDSCSLHQFTVALLQRRRVPYSIALLASGVAGLQSALAAGLGVACLNASALCAGVRMLPAPHGLPALPQAGFYLLPPRAGESEFVREARGVLAAGFG